MDAGGGGSIPAGIDCSDDAAAQLDTALSKILTLAQENSEGIDPSHISSLQAELDLFRTKRVVDVREWIAGEWRMKGYELVEASERLNEDDPRSVDRYSVDRYLIGRRGIAGLVRALHRKSVPGLQESLQEVTAALEVIYPDVSMNDVVYNWKRQVGYILTLPSSTVSRSAAGGGSSDDRSSVSSDQALLEPFFVGDRKSVV